MKHYSKTSEQFYRQLTKIKPKYLEKIGSSWFIYKKFQVMSTISELFGYNFLWKCLKICHKMDITTIQKRIFN